MDSIWYFLKDAALEVGGVKVTGYSILLVLVIVGLTRLATWSLKKIFSQIGKSRRIPLEDGRKRALFQIVRYVLFVIAFIMILNTIGVNISALVLSSAGLFVGLGLALQHTMDDIVSGIIILVDGTVEVEDMIEIESIGIAGRIKEIRLRNTLVETPDSVTVVVANSKFTRENVVNWNHNDRETRFKVEVGVAYGSDVSIVRKVLGDVAASHGLILKHPEPKVYFTEFADSSLNFALLFWSNRGFEIEEIKSDLRYKIDAEFRRNKIEIPFPQRDIHIKR